MSFLRHERPLQISKENACGLISFDIQIILQFITNRMLASRASFRLMMLQNNDHEKCPLDSIFEKKSLKMSITTKFWR
jgi:hypothetical protein